MMRLGICGCGSSLAMYEGIQLHNEKYKLAAVADIHSERNQTAREKWGITTTFTSPKEMFESKLVDLDLVIIATPPSTHRELTLEAAKRGLHVLVQKPLARTIEEGQQMIECCRQNNVGLKVSLVRRYYPAFKKANDLIKDLGQGLLLRAIWCSSSGRKKRESKLWKEELNTLGGVLVDLGSHVIDVAHWWMGEIIDRHLAFSILKGELDNIASFLLRHKSGSTTLCSLSNVDYRSKETYEYIASSGSFLLERTGEGYPGEWTIRIWKDEALLDELLFQKPDRNPFLDELSDYITTLENCHNGKSIVDPDNLGHDTLKITTLLYQSSIRSEDMQVKDINLKDIFIR